MPIDPDSLGELLDRYWAALVQWVGGREGAEDVVQSAFIKLATEEPTPTNCVAWLFTVAKRLAINEQASKSRRRLRELQSGKACSQSIDSSIGVEIRDMLGHLKAHEREIVVARIWGGLTFEEIAAACGDSKATIWRTYQCGIATLKAVYGELADE